MTEKQYRMINTNLADENGRIYYNIQRNDGVNICQVYGKNNAKSLIDELNELAEENQLLKDKYERKDRQLQRAKKDVRKYTDYFMNELNWDCDRIIKEVFR